MPAKHPKITPDMEKRKWKPGQSGNPAGRPKSPSIRDEIVKQLAADPKKLPEIVRVHLETCAKDSLLGLKARQDLFDRLEGRALQAVNITGSDIPILKWSFEHNGNHPAGSPQESDDGSEVTSPLPGSGVRATVGEDSP